MPPAPSHLVLVGGGFSAAALIAHLPAGVRVTVYEPRGAVGRGIAYSAEPCLVLNVPAGRMSMIPGQPDHFYDWLVAREPLSTRTRFAPRQTYGAYIQHTVAARGPAHTVVPHGVTGIRPDGTRWVVTDATGTDTHADAVVLCTGHWPSSTPAGAGDAAPVDPWRDGALAGVTGDDRVLVLGTGHTLADVVQTLRAQGHTGPIDAISRRGVVPQAHRLVPPLEEAEQAAIVARVTAAAAQGVGAVSSTVRAAAHEAVAAGKAWQAVMDAVRPHLPAVWSALSEADRRSFLRHGRPWWDAHRHRFAPEVAAALDAERAAGTLRVHGARLLRATRDGDHIVAQVQLRGAAQPTEWRVRHLINATGPNTDLRADPLIARMIADGLVTQDAHRLGLVTEGYASVGSGGARAGLYVLGPALRAAHWEATAVPELARHAAALAKTLAPAG